MRRLALVPVAAAIALVAGCSPSDDASNPTIPAVSGPTRADTDRRWTDDQDDEWATAFDGQKQSMCYFWPKERAAIVARNEDVADAATVTRWYSSHCTAEYRGPDALSHP